MRHFEGNFDREIALRIQCDEVNQEEHDKKVMDIDDVEVIDDTLLVPESVDMMLLMQGVWSSKCFGIFI